VSNATSFAQTEVNYVARAHVKSSAHRGPWHLYSISETRFKDPAVYYFWKSTCKRYIRVYPWTTKTRKWVEWLD